MYTSDELLDGIITEMYELFKALITGNYAGFCTIFTDMISKLAALRKGMKSDREAKDATIKDLEKQLAAALKPSTPAPGEEIIGGETTEYKFG